MYTTTELYTHIETLANSGGITLGRFVAEVTSKEDYRNMALDAAMWLCGQGERELALTSVKLHACADPDRRIVFTLPGALSPENFTPLMYTVMLHEIGHLMAPKGNPYKGLSPDQRRALDEIDIFTAEVAAWEWAIAHTKVWSGEAHLVMRMGLEPRICGREYEADKAATVELYKESHRLAPSKNWERVR